MAPTPATVTSTSTTTAAAPLAHQTDRGQSLRRHRDLWFEDGSVVLCAESTLFRVHMSLLSRHSVCFRDMFTIPQPSRLGMHDDPLKEYDACPVVHLHDTAEDVGNLLTALYDGPSFGNNDQDDFRIVSGILRLSTKYIIDSLRARAIAHLGVAWPSTLKGWDAREDLARVHEIKTAWSCPRYPSPIAVINLAREVDVPSLLPSAFYDLSRHSFAQTFEPNEDEPLLAPLTASSVHLTLQDLQKLALGKEAAQAAITSLIRSMGYLRQSQTPQHHTFPGSHPHGHSRKPSLLAQRGVCVSAAACRKEFVEIVDLATQHYLFDRERGCTDPLYVAEELGQLKSGGAEFCECKPCAIQLEMWAARERERLWKLIPTWFRLESSETSPKYSCEIPS